MQKPIILVLEDDRSISEVLKMVLENEGFYVRLTSTCAEAIKIIQGVTVKLAIVDYVLVDETADKFIEHMQKFQPTTPVMLITARSQSEVLAQSLKIKNLVKKPFDLETLIQSIRSLIS